VAISGSSLMSEPVRVADDQPEDNPRQRDIRRGGSRAKRARTHLACRGSTEPDIAMVDPPRAHCQRDSFTGIRDGLDHSYRRRAGIHRVGRSTSTPTPARIGGAAPTHPTRPNTASATGSAGVVGRLAGCPDDGHVRVRLMGLASGAPNPNPLARNHRIRSGRLPRRPHGSSQGPAPDVWCAVRRPRPAVVVLP
jgi:hypothetical protein